RARDPAPPSRRARPGGRPSRARRGRSREALSPGDRALVDAEAEALVQAQRAARVVGIDAERRRVLPAIAQHRERPRDERAREATPAPLPAGEDAVQPAATVAERGVLRLVDGVDDAAGDLVAVERD